LKSTQAILDAYFAKVAEVAATNAIATYTGAKKPSPPSKPKGPSSSMGQMSSPQGAAQSSLSPTLDPSIGEAMKQKSLNTGGEKLETGSTLPVTT
jgi:hypothetical protein